MDAMEDVQPVFSHVEPVLAVYDISKTISYWQDVLGFSSKWTWGQPPVHGGVSWQKIFIQFSLDPGLAKSSTGNSFWIRVQHVDVLYKFHQRTNAEIVSPLETKPWGMTEYTVREINGYLLKFSGVMVNREKTKTILPETISIIERIPTIDEYRQLASAVDWSPSSDDAVIKNILAAAVFAVVARNAGETIGSALLLGDHASFYYLKDVMVHPRWQGKRVGTMMMRAVSNWLEKHGANHALVALITREMLESFYLPFGFTKAFSMVRYIQRNDEGK